MSATQTPPADQNVQVVTQEDLLKTLDTLQGKTIEAPAPAAPVVAQVTLTKKLGDTVEDKGTEALKKALEVSTTLKEFSGILGTHVDNALQTMAKHVNDQAAVNMAVVTVLGEMKKSIDTVVTKIDELGKAPGAPAGAAPAGAAPTAEDVLKKGGELKTPDAKQTKARVLAGLEVLVKSLPAGDPAGREYSGALVKFESTGKITDAHLAEALKAAGGK